MNIQLLLVDDEQYVITSLVRMLLDENYTIITAGSSSEALDILKRKSVDIAIVDYMMPDTSGLELIKIMKTMYPEVTRIMLTGRPDLIAFLSAIKNGDIQHYICKPWDDESFKFKLRMITKGRKVIDPLCKIDGI